MAVIDVGEGQKGVQQGLEVAVFVDELGGGLDEFGLGHGVGVPFRLLEGSSDYEDLDIEFAIPCHARQFA